MDLTTQRAETLAVFRDIAAQGPLPDRANLDFQFVPDTPRADWQALTDTARRLGLKVHWYRDDPERPWIEITVTDCPVTLEAIWTHEERLTRLAASQGFAPDGWSLFVDAAD